MNSRKRPAPQPLLPIRNPKQPRLALTGYGGGTPSPSETEGIRSRWLTIIKQFTLLVGDTLTFIVPPIYTTTSIEEYESESPIEETPSFVFNSSSSPKTPWQSPLSILNSKSPMSTTQTRPISPPQFPSDLQRPLAHIPIATSDEVQSMQRPENIPLPASPTFFNFDNQNISSLTSIPVTFRPNHPDQSTPKNNVSSFASSTPTISPTPTRIPADSSRLSSTDSILQSNVMPSMRNLNLGHSLNSSVATSSQNSKASSLLSDSAMDIGSQTSRRSSHSSKKHSVRQNLIRREHIYMKIHKAKVQREKLELREKLTRELYALKQKTGYTSGFSDFKGLLDYERQLQNINLENGPPPLRGAPLLGTKITPQRRRQPVEIEDETIYLQRAIEKAKATMNGPKPPRPFVPTLDQLQISRRTKDEDIEKRLRPPVTPLPSKLPPEDERKVDEVLRTRGFTSKYAREQVSQTDLSRLQPGQWLNDEIINFYGAMLLGRSENCKENPVAAKGKKGKTAPLNIYYFSSFFWAKLAQEGYDKGRLAKWTKKIDIFSKDIIFMPVNHGNAHWTAAAINFRAKRFESYDSMGMAKGTVFRKLREYVKAEHQNKKKKEFDFTGWEDWAPDSTPQQENGFDCGVFTCQFMEALSRGEEFFNFSQKDMPYLRRRMIWEIAHAKLRDAH